MAKKNIFTAETLTAMGLSQNADGSYSRAKTVQQPREITIAKARAGRPIIFEKDKLEDIIPKPEYHSIRLVLMGEPMPKQSVIQGVNKSTGKSVFYQPKKKMDKTKDYIEQIKKQLPSGFVPFMEEVHVKKFHCIYSPLKKFQKMKGTMERIRNGEMVYKNTQPDLIDNLKKIVFDCLGKDKKTGIPLVLGNDGIIVTENDTAKFYGMGGCIVLELYGK